MMRIPGRTRLETVAGIVLALGLFAACGGSSSTAQDVVTPDVVGDTADVPTVDTPADTPVDIPPDTLIDTPVDTPVDVPTDTPVDPGPPPATTWTDPDTGLVWQDPPNADQLMKSAAIDYCANLTLDGHDDWRLPTISELRGLVRGCEDALTGGACGITDECLQESCKVAGTCSGCDSLQGPGTAGCYRVSALTGSCDIYWASSDDQTDGGRGWFVNFSLGKVDFDGGGNVHGVRCVRGGVEKLNPPAISAPLADAVVSSPIHVTGTAQPNAVLAAKILNGVTQIGVFQMGGPGMTSYGGTADGGTVTKTSDADGNIITTTVDPDGATTIETKALDGRVTTKALTAAEAARLKETPTPSQQPSHKPEPDTPEAWLLERMSQLAGDAGDARATAWWELQTRHYLKPIEGDKTPESPYQQWATVWLIILHGDFAGGDWRYWLLDQDSHNVLASGQSDTQFVMSGPQLPPPQGPITLGEK